MKRRRGPPSVEDEEHEPREFKDALKQPFNNPFGALASAAAPAEATKTVRRKAAPARARVRVELVQNRPFTRIEHLDLAASELDNWLRMIKSALDCDGSRSEGALLLLGDHRARAAAWLESRGVQRVTIVR